MEPRVVNSGIDSLVIGFNIAEYRDVEGFKLLEDAKAKAGEKLFGSGGASVNWHGKEFSVSAKGARGYEWILQNGDVRCCVAQKAEDRGVYPEVYVIFRAEYLWRVGHVNAVHEFLEWLESWAVVTGSKVSRCDLCMDVQMNLPEIDLAKEMVTRARSKVEYYEACEHYVGGRLDTGYRVGSGALIARIYDKSLEVRKGGKDWFETIWSANGWDGVSKVVRVEFQARRDFLKKMSVGSFESLCERLADMWRYYTRDWLSIRVPCGDSHRHRWPVRDWWQTIENGFSLFGEAYGVLPYRQYQLRQERLMKQAKGVLASAAAISSAGLGVGQGCFQIGQEIRKWLGSAAFRDAVIERKARFASMSAHRQGHLVDEAVRIGGQVKSVSGLQVE